MKNIKASLVILSFILFDSCNKDGNSFSPTNYNIIGKVEKGPFISGSTINLQPLDSKLAPLGSIYSSTITDDSGDFSFGTKKLDAPYVQLSVNGYYFNEVEGELSRGPISLRAVVSLEDKSTANVNILTHLKYGRIMQLVSQGVSFNDANTQAQKELLTTFGLQRYTTTDVSQFTITSGTDEAGALIAISSLLLSNRTEAEFTEYMAKLSAEFAESGTFSKVTIQQFETDRINLKSNLNNIADHVVQRYKDLGKDITVKDLRYYFDWDNDGIAGNEVGDGSENKVTLDVNKINAPVNGDTYSIKITASIPYTFDPLGGASSIPITSNANLIKTTAISLTKEVKNNTLLITVAPATGRIMEKNTIYIYDYMGDVLASLIINQKGTSTGEIFSEQGKSAVTDLMNSMSQAIALSHFMDAGYTKQLSNNFLAPLSASDTNISKSWANYYSYIYMCRSIRLNENSLQDDYLIPYVNTLEALGYYTMSTFWGDIPYVTKNDFSYYPRTSTSDIYEALAINLKSAIDTLENKKNDYTNNIYDNLLFSKDVANILLADIYMYQRNYADASTLLKNVISNGYYQLENSTNYTKSSREAIYVIADPSDASAIIPVFTYSDVLLSLAECEFHNGNEDKAKKYLNDVVTAKGISVSSDILTGIKQARNAVLLGDGGYFAFLKRNDLAIKELGLQEYQLLFPIPQSEIDMNPDIIQNPRY